MKRVIILEKADGGVIRFRYALWAAVPSSQQPYYAIRQATFVSAWKGPVGNAISQSEIDALRAGQVTEATGVYSTTSNLTLAQIKTEMEARWNVFQAAVTASNIFDRFGTFYDDTNAWTNAGAS